MKKNKIVQIIFIILVVVVIVFWFAYRNRAGVKSVVYENNNININENLNVNLNINVEPPASAEATAGKEPEIHVVEIPESKNLDIPFQSQAPHANWDMPYQEGCEEASIILSVKYLEGVSSLTASEMDAEILSMVAWQDTNWGGHHDLTAQETSDLLAEYYNHKYRGEVVYDFDWQGVKEALTLGYPVIVPTAGRQLGNPNYTPPGPLYHMLVIRGFDANYVYTNDVGTRKGENYKYTYDTMLNGIHDWNDGDVNNGGKAMIVVKYSNE